MLIDRGKFITGIAKKVQETRPGTSQKHMREDIGIA